MDNRKKSIIPLFFVKLYDSLCLGLNFLLFRRKPFSASHNFPEPFFIIGSGRSGNTLLRSMLVAGNEVSIPPESYVWPRVVRIYATYNFLPWEKLCSLIIAEFEAYKEFYTWEINLYEAHQNARKLPKGKRSLSHIINEVYKTYQKERNEENRIWGDKTPVNTFFIDKIYRVFPDSKYIHILREPKDVACSYIKAGLCENYRQAAEDWKLSVEKALSLKKALSPEQFFQIRYEELVQDPENTLKKIALFLNIPYSDSMLEFYKNTENLGDVKYGDHHKNIGNPVNTSSIGKWEKILSSEEKTMIEQITQATYEKTFPKI